MTTSRRVELIGGFMTAALSVTVLCTVLRPNSVDQFLKDLRYVIPALLVAVGSYLHASRSKGSGLVILFVGGAILMVGMPLAILGGAFYINGLWGGLLGLTPGGMAIVTMIAALVTRKAIAVHIL